MTPSLTLPILFWFLAGSLSSPTGETDRSGRAPEPVLRPIVSESRIWIEGSSNVNTFECVAETFQGEARTSSTLDGLLPTPDQWEVEVGVPVAEMDCGQRRMNRDLYESLKADDHPYIRFNYRRTLRVEPDMEWDQRIELQVQGDLEVAGVTKTLSIDAVGQRTSNGTLRIEGEKKIFMSDFSIDPPTGLLGLIRAHDQLTVHFQIIATPVSDENTAQSQPS